MLTTEGNSYLGLGKNKEAAVVFTKAADAGANPASAYLNLCITLFKMSDTGGAQSACDRAIAVDPAKAEAYFVRASILVGNSKMNAKGEVVPPPGTIEALKKYLELAPNGEHVGDARDMLKALGVTTVASATMSKKR
jgi:TPR repeat protein